MRKKSWLILIMLIAGFLRFYKLGINPPALTWDEATWGYNTYSLGSTGKDEFGRFLPVNYLESFGDFKPPVYVYLTVLPTKIFGLNEFATRFPSAFFGTLTVLLTYFLVKELFKEEPLVTSYSLIAAALLAVSPWHIMLSRAAFEANIASFFIVGGIVLFLMAVNKTIPLLVFSAFSLGLSLHTFNTARIVVPILTFILILIFRKKVWGQKKWFLISLIAGVLIILPAVSFFISPQARLRFKEVNIFSDSAVVINANQEIANDNNAFWSKIIHNRRWGYWWSFLRHYFDHFNPYFLFFKGDGNPKFSTQDVGELYLWELPFLIGGTLLLIKKKPLHWWFIPSWLLLGVIPAATARETPHALRIETTLPTWQILTAFGLVNFWESISKIKINKIFKLSILTFSFSLIIFNFLQFQHGYWRHYQVEYSGEWQYGYKPAVEFIKSVESQYDHFWFTESLGRPYIYFLFYLKYPPVNFWQEAKVERDTYGFVKVKEFGKYHFFRPGGAPFLEKSLYFDTPQNVPGEASIVKTFRLLNGEEILQAYEVTRYEKTE